MKTIFLILSILLCSIFHFNCFGQDIYSDYLNDKMGTVLHNGFDYNQKENFIRLLKQTNEALKNKPYDSLQIVNKRKLELILNSDTFTNKLEKFCPSYFDNSLRAYISLVDTSTFQVANDSTYFKNRIIQKYKVSLSLGRYTNQYIYVAVDKYMHENYWGGIKKINDGRYFILHRTNFLLNGNVVFVNSGTF